MIRIEIKTKKERGWKSSNTICPYLAYPKDELFVGTEFCRKCKYHVNHHEDIVWCDGDEHPLQSK